MDPALAAAITVIVTTIAAIAVQWANWMWPKGHHRANAGVRDEDPDTDD